MNARSSHAPVAIVGAGLAGLTAAATLRRYNVPITLYEAGKKIAGMAGSFHDSDGFTYDFGAHFITNRLAAAIGIGAHCRDVKHYGEAVLLNGKNYGYPFGLLKVPKFSLSGISSRIQAWSKSDEPTSAAEWFRTNYGNALANDIAIPLVEAWSGLSAAELSPSVGDKLQGGGVRQSTWLKLAAQVTQRAVANGYGNTWPENPYVWHVYPHGGLGLLCQKVAEGVEDAIHLESPIEEILVDDGRVVAVRSQGREQAVSAVISTAPCHILAKLVKGTDALKPLANFRYRAMVFVNLRMQGRDLLPDTVLWTPESEFPFFRLTETMQSMPWLAPEGKTLITVDMGCAIGDQIWQMGDEELGELCLNHLGPIIPDARQRYLGCRVLKTPIAYPVFANDYESARLDWARSTGVQGLYSVGRAGEFGHWLMEDVYYRTIKQMRQLAAQWN